MQRNATAAAEAGERYRPELIGDDEPRYLRRQKPVEIRRRKLSGHGWTFYRRVLLSTATGAAITVGAYHGTRFLLYAPSMLLLRPEQIELTGNHVVTREAVLKQFVEDRNRSVLRMSLDLRGASSSKSPGSSLRPSSVFSRIAFASSSPSARPSLLCAMATRWR